MSFEKTLNLIQLQYDLFLCLLFFFQVISFLFSFELSSDCCLYAQIGMTVVPVIGVLQDRKAFIPAPNAAEVEVIFDAPLEMFLKVRFHLVLVLGIRF